MWWAWVLGGYGCNLGRQGIYLRGSPFLFSFFTKILEKACMIKFDHGSRWLIRLVLKLHATWLGCDECGCVNLLSNMLLRIEMGGWD